MPPICSPCDVGQSCTCLHLHLHLSASSPVCIFTIKQNLYAPKHSRTEKKNPLACENSAPHLDLETMILHADDIMHLLMCGLLTCTKHRHAPEYTLCSLSWDRFHVLAFIKNLWITFIHTLCIPSLYKAFTPYLVCEQAHLIKNASITAMAGEQLLHKGHLSTALWNMTLYVEVVVVCGKACQTYSWWTKEVGHGRNVFLLHQSATASCVQL